MLKHVVPISVAPADEAGSAVCTIWRAISDFIVAKKNELTL